VRRKQQPRRRERGFTLVEVILAVALTAAVAALLFAAIGIGFKGMARIDAGADRLERRRQIDFLLRRQLGSVYPSLSAFPRSDLFAGTRDTVTFLAVDGSTGPGLYRVWLSLETDGGEQRLVMTRQTVAGGAAVGYDRTILARNVARLQLAYFGRNDADGGMAWQDRWEGRRLLPQLVRMRLTLRGEPANAWPDLVVRVWAGEGWW
jgi:prepilin-type N-terminal cleavage/methylation domain-containing protein